MNRCVKIIGLCEDFNKRQMLINAITTICNNSSRHKINSVEVDSCNTKDSKFEISVLSKFEILYKFIIDIELQYELNDGRVKDLYKDDYVFVSICRECNEDTVYYMMHESLE